jgi:hypothetical protein
MIPRRKFNGAKHSTEATGYRRQSTEDRRQMIKSFEDLDVFQRAYKVSLEIHKVSLEFPKREQYGLADQVRGVRANRSAQIWQRDMASNTTPRLNSNVI